jgi:hypothetical protein
MPENDAPDYVNAVLELYLQLPDTPACFSDLDYEQAEQWFLQQTPLEMVELALLLGASRRASRPAQAPPLPPIRSLRYFRPVLEELQANPLSPKVAAYLRYKAQKLLGLGSPTA